MNFESGFHSLTVTNLISVSEFGLDIQVRDGDVQFGTLVRT